MHFILLLIFFFCVCVRGHTCSSIHMWVHACVCVSLCMWGGPRRPCIGYPPQIAVSLLDEADSQLKPEHTNTASLTSWLVPLPL